MYNALYVADDEAAQIMYVIVILAAACGLLKCLLVDFVHFKVLFFSHFFSPLFFFMILICLSLIFVFSFGLVLLCFFVPPHFAVFLILT